MLKGKKLLILGGEAIYIPVVKRAKELGIYVVITDYHTNYDSSPAKYIADEAWNISWSEVELLEKKCYENKIDGILGGFSEFKVEYAIKLSKKLGLPCYCTEEQLEITRDKIKFKRECYKYGLPLVPEYQSLDECIKSKEYPFIVKPVDRAGSIGITVCRTKEELIKGYNYAQSLSKTKKVIIEKYLEHCQKVDLYYIIKNKEVKMLLPSESFISEKFGDQKIIQNCWIHSDKYKKLIEEKLDKKIRKMIAGMKLECGIIFFSTFVDQDDNFYLFECGYRLEGGITFKFSSKKYNYNYLDSMLEYTLMGNYRENDNFFNIDKKYLEGNSVTLNFYINSGKIKSILGLEKIKTIPGILESIQYVKEGDLITDEGIILQKALMFIIWGENNEILKTIIDEIYSNLQIINEKDENMIADKFNSEILLSY